MTVVQSVRPLSFENFIGQCAIKENISVCIQSAIRRKEAMEHVLFHGPPGLGKTTLANIVANELGVKFHSTSGPAITKSGDLAAILTNIGVRDVLFIDEIHRLPIAVEEIMYSAMEDFKIDIMIGEGASARTMKLNIKPFTLIGATTRLGLISPPLRARFGIPMNLEFYDISSLSEIVIRAAGKINAQIEPEGALEIAKRARGTPRIAIRLLHRVRDFALVKTQDGVIDKLITDTSLKALGIDGNGLDKSDLTYLKTLGEFYNGGPAGIDTLAAALSEDKGTIEDTIEPYLLQQGLIAKTPRGRILTAGGFKYIGLQPLAKPSEILQNGDLIDDYDENI